MAEMSRLNIIFLTTKPLFNWNQAQAVCTLHMSAFKVLALATPFWSHCFFLFPWTFSWEFPRNPAETIFCSHQNYYHTTPLCHFHKRNAFFFSIFFHRLTVCLVCPTENICKLTRISSSREWTISTNSWQEYKCKNYTYPEAVDMYCIEYKWIKRII